MCGRFASSVSVDDLAEEFGALDVTGDPRGADYNVAPTKPVVAVVNRPSGRELRMLRWGLVPAWASDTAIGAKMINARAETAAEKPAFRDALARRRCLIPADGWYEWSDGQPYYVTPADGSLLAFAGLYEFRGPLVTCAIVTTAAVGELARVHPRMPLVLPRPAWTPWLDLDRPTVAELLVPPADDLVAALDLRPVGRAVGNIANNDAALTEPEPDAVEPQTLF